VTILQRATNAALGLQISSPALARSHEFEVLGGKPPAKRGRELARRLA
jgi:hypothetical protein